MRLTDENYWNDGYRQHQFAEAKDGALVDFLNTHVENGGHKTCFEIGSFPGSYIPAIGRKGYELHGIDFNKRNADELPQWLSSLGLTVGEFWSGDFFDFIKQHTNKYDLVCSFGFIEHFENYPEMILAHINLLKPTGKIIITTPNFRGWMQYLPHKLFDHENLAKHNLKSMDPVLWKKILESNGFEVSFHGWFGKYNFWVDPNQKRSKLQQFMLKNVNRLIFNMNKIVKRTGKESKSYSAYCGIVAEKK